jgi:5-methylcytosine-specific restriction endonuclease McrA
MGQDEYELKSLADAELLSGLTRIVGRRNQITAEFLAYLAELDERQLFLHLGYSSLFEYCVEKLGLCESTAGRHIAAARACRNHPAAFGMVASGTLHASALSLMRKHLTSENAVELFELCSRRSARQVEDLLAARFPRPDVRDLIRRLPARATPTLDVGCSAEQSAAAEPCRERAPTADRVPVEAEARTVPVEALSHAPSGESAKGRDDSLSRGPSSASGAAAPKSCRIEPLSKDRFGVHFTADGEFCALLERVRGLAPRRVSRSVSGHRLPSGDLMTLLKRGLEAYERELEKERFAVGRKARRSRSLPETPNPNPDPSPAPKAIHNPMRRRHCPAEVTRAVFVRDGKQCTYVSPDGRRCDARRRLELDHIDPFSSGGEETIQNLRLRCRAHNQWYARQYFGSKHVQATIKHARKRRAARQVTNPMPLPVARQATNFTSRPPEERPHPG